MKDTFWCLCMIFIVILFFVGGFLLIIKYWDYGVCERCGEFRKVEVYEVGDAVEVAFFGGRRMKLCEECARKRNSK